MAALSSNGTVFTITTSGAESVIHSFAGRQRRLAARCMADLINVGGVLYGTTRRRRPVLKSCLPAAQIFSDHDLRHGKRAVYSFAGGSDGAYPGSAALTYVGRRAVRHD